MVDLAMSELSAELGVVEANQLFAKPDDKHLVLTRIHTAALMVPSLQLLHNNSQEYNSPRAFSYRSE